MAFEHKPDTGTLFKNDKKGNPKAPDYKGKINAGGKLMDIAGWMATDNEGNLRRDRDGNPFMSLKISEPYAPKDSAPASSGFDDFEDQKIPF